MAGPLAGGLGNGESRGGAVGRVPPAAPRALLDGERGLWPRPVLPLAVAWMAGVVLSLGFELTALVGQALVVIGLGMTGWGWRQHARAHNAGGFGGGGTHRIVRGAPRGYALLLAVAGLALWRTDFTVDAWMRSEAAIEQAEADPTRRIVVEGSLARDPEFERQQLRGVLAAGARIIHHDGAVALEAPIAFTINEVSKGEPGLRGLGRGDVLRLRGRFQPRTEYWNPVAGVANTAETFGRIAGRVAVDSPVEAQVLGLAADAGWARRALAAGGDLFTRWRANALKALAAVGTPEAGAALTAIVLGDTSGLTAEQFEEFRRTGLIHLFSVSGMHAALIAAAIHALLGPLGLAPRQRSALTAVGVVAYAALAEFSVPVVRTTIMVLALASREWIGRSVDSMSRLFLAALLVLAVDPLALVQIDFQLSFLGAFTLIAAQPALAEWFPEPGELELPAKWKRGVRVRMLHWSLAGMRGFALLVVLQLALAPLLLQGFQSLSLIAPMANLLVSTFAGVALVSGGVLIGPGLGLPVLSELAAPVAAGATQLSLRITSELAAPSWAAVTMAPMPWFLLIPWYGLLFCGWPMRWGPTPGDRHRRMAHAILQALALIAILVVFAGGRAVLERDWLRMTFLDVGQGDATLIELPRNGGVLLYDGGPAIPPFSTRQTIEPVLRYRGIEQIDFAIATHADADHIGAFPSFLESGRIKTFAWGRSGLGSPYWKAIEDALGARPVATARVQAGRRLDVGNPAVDLRFLHPDEAGVDRQGDRNTDSVALRIAYGDFSALLTGDADEAAERTMIERLGAGALQSLLLKAGHHGSRTSTSSEFVRAVSPRWAVISCGRGNRYGHPSAEVVERLRAAGALVHRTDLHGALTLETDGRVVRWQAWRK